MSFKLHRKSWVRVKEDLGSSDTVIVPLGSLEAHGAHKPVGCCYLLAEAASRDLGERTGVIVTPVIPFGVSDSYKNFPGTVTVSMEALSRYVREASESLIRSGYRKIIFLSAHGGDNLSVLRELSFRLREEHGALCAVVHVWGVISRMVPPNFWGEGHRTGHGGEPTTSVMLHLHPELVDMSRAELRELRQPMEGFKTRSQHLPLRRGGGALGLHGRPDPGLGGEGGAALQRGPRPPRRPRRELQEARRRPPLTRMNPFYPPSRLFLIISGIRSRG